MKIVSYNLRNGGNTDGDNHWRRLIREFDPDIICAQESLPPEQYFSPDEFSRFKGCVHGYVPHGRWGSAILSTRHSLEPVALPEFGGWVVGARVPDAVIGGTVQSVLIYCVHAPSPGPYEPAVIRILACIAKQWDQTPLVLAGDFNVTTALRHPTEEAGGNTAGEREIQAKLRQELGLFNAWQVIHPNENLPQTLRWTKDPLVAYHCDAVFLSGIHLRYLVGASIPASSGWQLLSDHNPIVVEIA